MIGSIRRALARYFGRPATSVSPKSAREIALDLGRPDVARVFPVTPAALDRVEEAANRVYWSAPSDFTSWEPQADTGSIEIVEAFPETTTGIKPPDEWTWEAWAKEFGHLAIDGWAPCKFAHRAGHDTEKAIFVFGVVRGAFGLWQQPFDVCIADEDGYTARTDTLTVVTHLRSGIGMGIFATKGDAAQACSLASRLVPWETIEHEDRPAWVDAAQRTVNAWHEIGIVASTSAHAHDPSTGNGPFPIMGLSAESAAVGKPEKLS